MIRFPQLESLGVAVAAFSEKSDGNCGLRGVSNAAGVLASRRAVCRACGADEGRLVCAQQVHSPNVAWVTADNAGAGATVWETGLDATDGLLTQELGLPLGILVADCVPLYIVDPRRRVAGLAHAGREGTRADIAGRAVAELVLTAGANPDDLVALIGPSAGPCCYEVSPEIAAGFAEAGLPVRGRRLDLWEANVQQLADAGVPRNQIAVVGACTICDGRFYSYRAGDTTERNLAVLML
ncbi:MAG: laccase domain-containing protein [Candidatus Hydrogenedentes bacterium]|nr:laccase domain-containing protein [Candidatus Hydrogenedentota bacterium]